MGRNFKPYNAPVVWGVAGSLPRCRRGVRVGMRYWNVPINGQDLSCHDKIVQMASKKQGTPSLCSGQAPRRPPAL